MDFDTWFWGSISSDPSILDGSWTNLKPIGRNLGMDSVFVIFLPSKFVDFFSKTWSRASSSCFYLWETAIPKVWTLSSDALIVFYDFYSFYDTTDKHDYDD